MTELVVHRDKWCRGAVDAALFNDSDGTYCIIGYALHRLCNVPDDLLVDAAEAKEVLVNWANDTHGGGYCEEQFYDDFPYEIPSWLNESHKRIVYKKTIYEYGSKQTFDLFLNNEAEIIRINDAKDIPDDIREEWLIEAFKNEGIELKFVGDNYDAIQSNPY